MKDMLDSVRRLFGRLRGRPMGAGTCSQCGATIGYGSGVCPNGHKVR
jgi:hypothetical protein